MSSLILLATIDQCQPSLVTFLVRLLFLFCLAKRERVTPRRPGSQNFDLHFRG
jgi:hypothetical protein